MFDILKINLLDQKKNQFTNIFRNKLILTIYIFKAKSDWSLIWSPPVQYYFELSEIFIFYASSLITSFSNFICSLNVISNFIWIRQQSSLCEELQLQRVNITLKGSSKSGLSSGTNIHFEMCKWVCYS